MHDGTLFATTLDDCSTCGRPIRNGICSWCAAGDGYGAKAAATAAVVKDAEWHQRANDYRRNLGPGQTITADDLRMHVGLPCGSTNQIGALMHSWASKGLIRASGFTTSSVKGNHGRILREWEILA
jgi:hypothetical protein